MTTSPTRAQARAWHIKGRRAAGYLLMSAVLPGSVQVRAGAPRVGRAALRIWGALAGCIGLIVVGLLLVRGPTIALLLNAGFLFVAKVVMWLVALGWAVLLADSWRRADPMGQPRRARLAMTGASIVLAVAMIGATALVSTVLTAAGDVSTIFRGDGDSNAENGRYNILLLGADSGPGREGMRPDSIMVASIDATSGRTVLFSLPRNLEGAPLPASNALHKLYPNGYDCPKSKCMLNGVYTLAHDNASLFPGVDDPGLTSMQDAVGTILGLKINYYALVDLAGFRALIDAVGGIRLDIGRRIPIGGVSTKVSGYIEPGKNVHLDGFHALWFARSRHDSSDYDRMARQKCVLNAMVKQLDPLTVATKFGDLAAAGKGTLQTSVPTGDISKLIDLALAARSQKISSVSFAPPLIQPGRPDFALIRTEVVKSIEKSNAQPAPATAASALPSQTVSKEETPMTKTPAATQPSNDSDEAPRETEDLGAVCSVSSG